METDNNKPLTVKQLRDFLANLPPEYSDNSEVYLIDPSCECHLSATKIETDYFGGEAHVIVIS